MFEVMILVMEFEVDGEMKVKFVRAFEGVEVGASVTSTGMIVLEMYLKECKSKFWDVVKEKFVVKDGKVVYDDKVFVCVVGECTALETFSGSFIK